ncbi:hypothetical protein CLV93_104185 [Prolixibacter denitrificans]|uniref:Uncharacterized protein n=1 Tax=Prolixibacter denitrificans TaxID=1541063 RepID=A0A2P8CE44_9BACT|nr:hypothetical protein CLV93_104185 [Prolixibacter denitrificans]
MVISITLTPPPDTQIKFTGNELIKIRYPKRKGNKGVRSVSTSFLTKY